MNLEEMRIAYPYKAFDRFERNQLVHKKTFEEFKKQIFDWVESSTPKSINLLNKLNFGFELVNQNNETNIKIYNWLITHTDKLVYVYDFSGIDFGIQAQERYSLYQLRFPTHIDPVDAPLYPDYDEHDFKAMDIISKLDWLYAHCEFIPYREIEVDMEDTINHDMSHKYSRISENSYVMSLLNKNPKLAHFKPKKDRYYFVKYDARNKVYYLQRDLEKSPK